MNGASPLSWTLHFAPLVSHDALILMIAAGAVLLLASLFLYRRGFFWRLACLAVFLLLFLNPSLVEEEREAVRDIAVAVLDRSPSQSYGDRAQRAEDALAHIRNELEARDDIELRVVDAPATSGLSRETRLFEALELAYADIPLPRRAGAILITDGQVHDVPAAPASLKDTGPIHALLTGDKSEKDRQLVILEAPGYGIVGQDVTIRYRIEDTANIRDKTANLLIRSNGKTSTEEVEVNTDQAVRVTIGHGGQNIFDMQADPVSGEITEANNRAPIIINGVRDRLRVLLVSGQPHAGGRTWRDMLTSDPGVDLVHFTILREPDKLDATPQNELSLIAFPFRELFEIKLYDFDLIIFDRYRLNRILPDYYFANIVKYVRNGGALMEISGPSFAGEDSIFTTELGSILPGTPTGSVLEQSFTPTITEVGARHPVTGNLHWAKNEDGSPAWGHWLRQIPVSVQDGQVVMTGVDQNPLLILSRVDEGRVAQLSSDQIWLWSRGYENGGPYAELMRRIAHWLMKEPELEENALNVHVDGESLIIRRHVLDDKTMDVRITAPNGTVITHSLTVLESGLIGANIPVSQLGIYMVSDGTQQRFAIVGDLNPPELRGVITTQEKLAPSVRATKGNILWLADTPAPDIRILPPGRDFGGGNWLGLRHSGSYSVTGVMARPFLPPWAWALALLGIILAAWWAEGGKRRKRR